MEPGDGHERAALLLRVGDAFFDGENAREKATDTVRWLLGSAHALTLENAKVSRTEWAFPDGGYYLFGVDFGEKNEIKGMVDCGALGYLGIAAHGHADALAVTLSIAGEECLVDPGTFSYWNELKWRAYFRGTSAHNTVRIDGLDQSVSGGRFMWTRKANTRVDRAPDSPNEFAFVGSHDGYRRLPDAVRPVRRVQFDAASKVLMVRDEVIGKQDHVVEQFWHFAPDLKIELNGTNAVITGKHFVLRAEFSGTDIALNAWRGSEEPPLGWFSRCYEAKEPCTTLQVSAKARSVAMMAKFSIEIHGDGFDQ